MVKSLLIGARTTFSILIGQLLNKALMGYFIDAKKPFIDTRAIFSTLIGSVANQFIQHFFLNLPVVLAFFIENNLNDFL